MAHVKNPLWKKETKSIFLSHREAHLAKGFTQIIESLSRKRIRCFVANQNIQQGEPFRDEIHKAIDNSIAVVGLLTSASIDRHWVNYELGYAEAKSKPIFPFLLSDDLNNLGTHPLGNRHYIKPNVVELTRLIKTLFSLAEVPLPPKERLHKCARSFLHSITMKITERSQSSRLKRHLDMIDGRIRTFYKIAT